MSKVYCGIGDVPKGKKRGSMKECAEMGQVRYFGLKKIDQRILDYIASKKIGENKEKKLYLLMGDYVSVSGKIKKVTGQLKTTKDKKEKMKIEDNIEKLKVKLDKLKKEIKKFKQILNK